MDAAHVVVGRQPIFDRDLFIIGYELLFRSASFPHRARGAAPGSRPGDEMTASVFSGALSIGLHRLVGDKAIFCNADRGVLSGSVPLLLPPDRTTVELTDCTRFDAELETGCRTLVAAGYRLALDDFGWFPEVEQLLSLASVVKIDVRQGGVDHALELAERVRGFDVQTVAHKVETEAELERCLNAGFDLFQGFALARPTTVTGATLEASELGVLQISAAALDANTDIAEVERTIRRDPALTVQLLEIASIGPLGEMRRPVRSIRDALVLLGTQRLRSWVTLLMLRTTRKTTTDELLTVLVRARTCELLADPGDAAFAFTAGMVSAMDRFLGIPAAELSQLLPLGDEILQAAFAGVGPVGRLVQRTIRAESDGRDDAAIQVVTTPALDWALQSAELLELH